MKIHFDNVDFNSSTGPNTFGRRLAQGLIVEGHEISLSGYDADVSIVFISPTGNKLAKKVIQRLDGIWTKPNEFIVKNSSIKSLYESANAIIHQTNFDKIFIESNWGTRTQSYVINNGINVTPITQFKSAAIAQIRSQYDYVFVCSANWHRQKRLKENTELFFHIRKLLNKKCCLIVMGNAPDHLVSDKDIFYTNSIPQEICLEIFSAADWMIHLAWRDHCPNTVVECLSQQTPVICTSDSGTNELINGFGISLNEQFINDLLPYDYDVPPQINVEQLKTLIKPNKQLCPDVSMKKCVANYVDVIKNIF